MRNAANKICCVLVLHIFGTSINLALLGGNGNTLLENDDKIKDKRTSIATVCDQYPTYAIFSYYRLPLRYIEEFILERNIIAT